MSERILVEVEYPANLPEAVEDVLIDAYMEAFGMEDYDSGPGWFRGEGRRGGGDTIEAFINKAERLIRIYYTHRIPTNIIVWWVDQAPVTEYKTTGKLRSESEWVRGMLDE